MNLKKTITFDVCGHNYEVPADFRAIELVENVYQAGADYVITLLADARAIRRTQVARVISQWPRDLARDENGKPVSRQEIYEAVIESPPEQLSRYVGCIQGAVGYALNYIDEEAMEKLQRGEDLDTLEKPHGGS